MFEATTVEFVWSEVACPFQCPSCHVCSSHKNSGYSLSVDEGSLANGLLVGSGTGGCAGAGAAVGSGCDGRRGGGGSGGRRARRRGARGPCGVVHEAQRDVLGGGGRVARRAVARGLVPATLGPALIRVDVTANVHSPGLVGITQQSVKQFDTQDFPSLRFVFSREFRSV